MSRPTLKLLVRRPDGTISDLGLAVIDGGSAFTIIEKTHAQIHNGMAYAGGKVGAALGASAMFYLVGQNNNPDGKSLHISAAFSASAAVIVRTLGGITGKTGGSSEPSYNRKTGLTDSGVDVFWGATPDSGASSIKETYIPGGGGPQALGGQALTFAERIVPAGAWIGIEVENVSGAEIDHFGVEWDYYLAPAG